MDEIVEEISFRDFEDDFHLLKSLLNNVLQCEVGQQFTKKFKREQLVVEKEEQEEQEHDMLR